MANDLCLIGSITAPHGIRGAVRVQSFSDIPERFARLDAVLVGRDEGAVRSMRITQASGDGQRVILEFDGCGDREAAEQLVGCNLYVTEEQMEAPPDGRYFIHDLVGCAVRTPDGADRGEVKDVMLLPANDVYVVDCRGLEVLVPAVPAFIRSVDIAGKMIVVENVAGLFEDIDED